MSSLNSQYAASMSSGSAQTPLVQFLPSIFGKALYLAFPLAIAIRYDGIEVGYHTLDRAQDTKFNVNIDFTLASYVFQGIDISNDPGA